MKIYQKLVQAVNKNDRMEVSQWLEYLPDGLRLPLQGFVTDDLLLRYTVGVPHTLCVAPTFFGITVNVTGPDSGTLEMQNLGEIVRDALVQEAPGDVA